MKKIDVGDRVYTFIKGDRYPVAFREVKEIRKNSKGLQILLKPCLGTEYLSHEETTTVNLEDAYLDEVTFNKAYRNSMANSNRKF